MFCFPYLSATASLSLFSAASNNIPNLHFHTKATGPKLPGRAYLSIPRSSSCHTWNHSSHWSLLRLCCSRTLESSKW